MFEAYQTYYCFFGLESDSYVESFCIKHFFHIAKFFLTGKAEERDRERMNIFHLLVHLPVFMKSTQLSSMNETMQHFSLCLAYFT